MPRIRLPKNIRRALWIIGIISLLWTSIQASRQPPAPQPNPVQAEQPPVLGETTATASALVDRVVDGDTIRVIVNNEKKTVRLIGIDTPETVDPRREVECFGKEASNRLKELIEDKEVILETDSSQQEIDRYGRLLRYVSLNGVSINEQLIYDGFASEYTYNNPYKYREQFQAAQEDAKKNQRGLWNPQICAQ
jgi:micrococcal nuclease